MVPISGALLDQGDPAGAASGEPGFIGAGLCLGIRIQVLQQHMLNKCSFYAASIKSWVFLSFGDCHPTNELALILLQKQLALLKVGNLRLCLAEH